MIRLKDALSNLYGQKGLEIYNQITTNKFTKEQYDFIVNDIQWNDEESIDTYFGRVHREYVFLNK